VAEHDGLLGVAQPGYAQGVPAAPRRANGLPLLAPGLLLAATLLLALLLHRLYELPEQVARLSLHLDGVGLVGVVHLEQVLYLPYAGQGTPHELNGALLLLLLLLLAALLLTSLLLTSLLLLTTLLLLAALLLLLLIVFRHDFSLLIRNPIAPTYPGRRRNKAGGYAPSPARRRCLPG
jgi:hypothetical protein